MLRRRIDRPVVPKGRFAQPEAINRFAPVKRKAEGRLSFLTGKGRRIHPVTPIISAAFHHFSFPAAAFGFTSCAVIVRSTSAFGICCSVHSTAHGVFLVTAKPTASLMVRDHVPLSHSRVFIRVPVSLPKMAQENKPTKYFPKTWQLFYRCPRL